MSSSMFDVKGDGMIALNILKNNIRSYLNRVIPGLITRIEWHFLRKYSRSFIDMIFEDPSLALKELMDFYGGDSDSAEYIMYFALKIIFRNNHEMISKAMTHIRNGDVEEFKKMFKSEYGSSI